MKFDEYNCCSLVRLATTMGILGTVGSLGTVAGVLCHLILEDQGLLDPSTLVLITFTASMGLIISTVSSMLLYGAYSRKKSFLYPFMCLTFSLLIISPSILITLAAMCTVSIIYIAALLGYAFAILILGFCWLVVYSLYSQLLAAHCRIEVIQKNNGIDTILSSNRPVSLFDEGSEE